MSSVKIFVFLKLLFAGLICPWPLPCRHKLGVLKV